MMRKSVNLWWKNVVRFCLQNSVLIAALLCCAGARLVYLPPYSPDFNPIEEAFSAMKAWLRQNEGMMMGEEQIPWLIFQASSAITPDDALGWFTDCSYL